MKQDVEYISPRSWYKTGFICSFGYRIIERKKRVNPLDDLFIMRNIDTLEVVKWHRRDFFDKASKKHGGIIKCLKPTDLNPCGLDYPMF